MDETKMNTTGSARSGSDTAAAAKFSSGQAAPDIRAAGDATGQGSGRNWSGRQDAAGQGGVIGGTLSDATEAVRESGQAAVRQVSEWAGQGVRQFENVRSRSMDQFRRAGGGLERYVRENPLMVGVMGLAAGLVIGALLPRTRQEDRAFGRWADEVRDQGMRYARDATQRGRSLVEEALGGESEFEGGWRGDDQDRDIRSGPRYQNH
jgi:ElaB/YqjD/DUF883 family membrane-anchored ribosome-binding protein